jgi:hypothetical protein
MTQTIEYTNGHQHDVTLADIQQVTTTNKPKSTRKPNVNTIQDIEINLDAGANHIKGIVKYGEIEQSIHFPSRAKTVDGNISIDNVGNFQFQSTNYASGKSAEYYLGEWLEAKEGNKIDFIHIWLLSALSHAKEVLIKASKAKRSKNKPVNLCLWVRLLTLSKERRGEILENLNTIKSFSFNGEVYQLTIGCLEVFTEGYGSALAAWDISKKDDSDNQKTESINVLDMGGGTLSYTSYSTEFDRLEERERTIANCGGINAIVATIHTGLNSRDQTGVTIDIDFIEKALRKSKSKTLLYDLGSEITNIFNNFESAMSEWLRKNPQVVQVLKTVRFALMNGEKIYLTGGGFCSVVIEEYIKQYLCKMKKEGVKNTASVIKSDLIIKLDNCHNLNITGLKLLPSLKPERIKKVSKHKTQKSDEDVN